MLLFEGIEGDPEASDKTTVDYNASWGQYMRSLAQRGMLESGLPLAWEAKRVTREGVADQAMAPVDIGGYLVINAASLDEATTVAGQAPHIALGGTTIVRTCLEPPGAGA